MFLRVHIDKDSPSSSIEGAAVLGGDVLVGGFDGDEPSLLSMLLFWVYCAVTVISEVTLVKEDGLQPVKV